MGFSPQKPIRRAYERNDQRVRIWLEKEYPAIAARARQEKAEIHWGDETGLRSDDVKGRSYAPKGKTPVQYVKAAPEKLNMISTVTNRGLMRFMFYRETMTAQLLIRFLKRLIRSSQKKIFLILDNLRVHHSKLLQEWLTENKAFIEIFLSAKLQSRPESRRITEPGFESGPFKTPAAKRNGELEEHAKSHMRSIQKQPEKIKALFHKESVKYAG
ncbi:MAG: IS630 family transposase [Lentisphaeria bacterium]|nr:MAG: IS630 family transposase [Lentisphaeria bacterium]